jgi:hypothetical protein
VHTFTIRDRPGVSNNTSACVLSLCASKPVFQYVKPSMKYMIRIINLQCIVNIWNKLDIVTRLPRKQEQRDEIEFIYTFVVVRLWGDRFSACDGVSKEKWEEYITNLKAGRLVMELVGSPCYLVVGKLTRIFVAVRAKLDAGNVGNQEGAIQVRDFLCAVCLPCNTFLVKCSKNRTTNYSPNKVWLRGYQSGHQPCKPMWIQYNHGITCVTLRAYYDSA